MKTPKYKIYDHKLKSYVFGDTQKEIAEAIDINPSTLRQLFYGRLKSVAGRFTLDATSVPNTARGPSSIGVKDITTGEVITAPTKTALGELLGVSFAAFTPLQKGTQKLLLNKYEIIQ